MDHGPDCVNTVNYKPVFMTQKYPIVEPRGYYSLTLNTIDRVDIFIRPFFKQIIVESLNYFIEKKGLIVNGWCLMTNHLHLIVEAKDGWDLASLIRDLKLLLRKSSLKILTLNLISGAHG
jgi:REP element-mobilizing transposase RayT